MADFDVFGPFGLPQERLGRGRAIDEDAIYRCFWDDAVNYEGKSLARMRGVYVFAMRAGKGYTPYYVGKTAKNFAQEVFNHRNLKNYNRVIADRIGTPVIFLLPQFGRKNEREIGEVEVYLIESAATINPDLINTKGTRLAQWAIYGVVRSGSGKPTTGQREFKRLLKLA